MSDELSPEREKYLIEQAARYIVQHGLEDFAQMVLEGTAPFGDIVGELGFMMTYPLAVTFFGRTGSDFINMIGFNYKTNAKRILDRVAELKEEKKKLEAERLEQERLKGKRRGLLS
ncbi:MAG: hypothetical protein QXT81_04405, partial [Candidatus Bathyarchaeia archaeon]